LCYFRREACLRGCINPDFNSATGRVRGQTLRAITRVRTHTDDPVLVGLVSSD